MAQALTRHRHRQFTAFILQAAVRKSTAQAVHFPLQNIPVHAHTTLSGHGVLPSKTSEVQLKVNWKDKLKIKHSSKTISGQAETERKETKEERRWPCSLAAEGVFLVLFLQANFWIFS